MAALGIDLSGPGVGAVREAVLLAFDNDSIPFRHGLQLELIAAQGDGGNPVVPLGGPRAADTGLGPSGNRAERLEWCQTLGLGLFIHWSVDSQLGIVIRHSLGGASTDDADRFFNGMRT